MKSLRIGFLLPRTSLHSRSYTSLVMRALAGAGVDVDLVYPVDQAVDLSHVRVEHDLYVLRKTSGLAFSLAGALHALGAVVVNPYPVTAALRDKVISFRILQAAGIPTPATHVASHARPAPGRPARAGGAGLGPAPLGRRRRREQGGAVRREHAHHPGVKGRPARPAPLGGVLRQTGGVRPPRGPAPVRCPACAERAF